LPVLRASQESKLPKSRPSTVESAAHSQGTRRKGAVESSTNDSLVSSQQQSSSDNLAVLEIEGKVMGLIVDEGRPPRSQVGLLIMRKHMVSRACMPPPPPPFIPPGVCPMVAPITLLMNTYMDIYSI